MPFRLRIHRSFIQLFVVLVLIVAFQGRGFLGVGQFVSGFVLLFATVVLHELSHAFAARALGVRVRDIVLHPLGGMTRLDWTAADPRKEALISSAGPAINLVLAAALWLVLRATGWDAGVPVVAWVLGPLLLVNVALGTLNLVPAFPMDGGRILRAVLSTRVGHLPATRLAVRIGRVLALLALLAPLAAPAFGWSVWQSLVLPVLGLFIFMLGEIELKRAEAGELLARMGAAMGAGQGPSRPEPIEVEATARVVDGPGAA
jgi:Zn-dependent protease